jgi:sterol 3beta-glucosyltransferase
MRIGIQTWGSEGDIRPVLALAASPAARDHRVRLAVTGTARAEHVRAAERQGVELRVMAVPGLEDAEAQDRQAEAWIGARSPLRQAEMILRDAVDPAVDAMTATAHELCAGSDVVIGHFFVHPLHAAAERVGVPLVTLHLAHTSLPSAFIAPPGMPSFGRLGRRAGWALTRLAINRLFLARVNHVRTRVGLPPLRDVMTQAWVSRSLTLVGVSRAVCPQPPDWPSTQQVCGFLEGAAPEDADEVPAPLREFLGAGDPPVYFTFGSLMPQGAVGADAIVRAWSEAARDAQVRAILQVPRPLRAELTGDVSQFVLHRGPHAHVFPRCAAVVHHGEAGTVHTTLRAGVPSVVVPHVADQFFWASELRRLGVAHRAVPRRGLRATPLARVIRKTVLSPSLAVRARELRTALQEEHGVSRAVHLIEELASARLPQAAADLAASRDGDAGD